MITEKSYKGIAFIGMANKIESWKNQDGQKDLNFGICY